MSSIGAAEWNDAFLLAGYAESRWPAVAGAWADWNDGQLDPISRLYQATGSPGDDNSYAAFNATLCTDGPFPREYAKVRKDAYSIAKEAPFLTWGGFWYSMPCTFWPAKAGKPVKVDGSKVKSVLLVNATLDGATPYAGALAVRKEFPAASLIAEVGATTHGGSLQGNKCVDEAIATYLDTGAVPRRVAGKGPDLKCDRLPQPEPSPLDRSRRPTGLVQPALRADRRRDRAPRQPALRLRAADERLHRETDRRRVRRRRLAASGLAGAESAVAAPKITWGACQSQDLVVARAQCGFLSVPLDYTKPNGRKIQARCLPNEGDRQEGQPAGRHAGQPGRAGRLGAEPVDAARRRPAQGGPVLRLDRLRPARGRVEQAGPVVRRRTTPPARGPTTSRRPAAPR